MDATNKATYKSSGVEVAGYLYRPAGNGPFPTALVLHGKAGFEDLTRSYASWLATQGYVALAPDYFTPVSLTRDNFDMLTFEKSSLDSVREHLATGLAALKSLSYVDPKRLGIVGFSLGGYLGFILASRDDVKGVVSYYGAYPPGANVRGFRYPYTDIVAQMKAPVLMLHGDKDELVPIANANMARDLLTSAAKQFEYVVYPGAGHTFNAPAGPLANPQATADAQQKTITFLKAKLQ